MLPQKDIEKIREELNHCSAPLFLFDDDPDGLTSFLLLYRQKQAGDWSFIKASAELGEEFLQKVHDSKPDKIFVLDKPIVSQEFIDQAKVPIIWIDHHPPVKRHNVKYFNPRVYDFNDSPSTSRLCYEVVKQDLQQDLWIAMIGITGDWQLTELSEEYRKQFPELYPENIRRPEDALFASRTGQLVRIFSSVLKGKTSEVKKCIRQLMEIKDPYDILEQRTKEGIYVYRHYEKVAREYQKLLAEAKEQATDDKLLIYSYTELNTSFTSDLSNELLYTFPDKFIVVCRNKSGEMKCSLRYAGKRIQPILEKAFSAGVRGYGGGHDHACGANIKEDDFGKFLDVVRDSL
ncbi:DHH family phosphoesterase [Candidatus Woesearchaeota archaeon]|nr:DHH family phosphoesterase [Candidatus Woesearchaeota archaeon]